MTRREERKAAAEARWEAETDRSALHDFRTRLARYRRAGVAFDDAWRDALDVFRLDPHAEDG